MNDLAKSGILVLKKSVEPFTGMDCRVVDQEKLYFCKRDALKPNWSILGTYWRKIMHAGSTCFGQTRQTRTFCPQRCCLCLEKEGRDVQLKKHCPHNETRWLAYYAVGVLQCIWNWEFRQESWSTRWWPKTHFYFQKLLLTDGILLKSVGWTEGLCQTSIKSGGAWENQQRRRSWDHSRDVSAGYYPVQKKTTQLTIHIK